MPLYWGLVLTKKNKMPNYSFKTVDGFRIDVKANNPKQGFKTLVKIYGNIICPTYLTYKNGLSSYNWKQNLKWSEYLAK